MPYQLDIKKFYLEIIAPYKWWYTMMITAPVVSAFFLPVCNYSLKLIIDYLSKNSKFTILEIIEPVAIFCIAVFASQMIWRIYNYGDYRSQPLIEAQIINKSYAMLLTHNYEFFQNNLSGKTASQIATLRDKYISLHDRIFHGMLYGILTILVSLVIFFKVHFSLALATFIWLLVAMPVFILSKKKQFILTKNSSALRQKITGLLNDSISNISTVLLYSNRNFEKNLLNKTNDDWVKAEEKRIWFINVNHFVIGLIYAVIPILTLFLMLDLYQKKLVSLGDLVMVLGLMFHIFDNSWILLTHVDGCIQDFGQLKEAFEIFNPKNIAEEKQIPQNLKIQNPQIKFQNVNFKYYENAVLEDFNLAIEPFQKIGLVGHSGAGKSTVINLLLKIFNNYQGKIIIDKSDIATLNNDDLRANIALIPQDPALFHRTIFDNIAYGNVKASMQEVIDCAKKAKIHDFIMTLPNQYQTLVGERGVKLSGGQKQRIAIARALLKKAPILILDEATSSLDSKTENEIQQAINDILEIEKITVIAIAHRLSTIKNMDRIIVLENGKIVEDDNFLNLIANDDSKFKAMWQHQVNFFIN